MRRSPHYPAHVERNATARCTETTLTPAPAPAPTQVLAPPTETGPPPRTPLPTQTPHAVPASRAIPAPLLRDVLGIAIPTGAFGLSFGALAAASGFTTAQTCTLSLLMFTGGSQFALVGSIAAGGAAPTATAVAILLGGRNALYGLRISALLRGAPPPRRALAAHLVIDESAAMAAAQEQPAAARTAFWATGLAIFTLWNLGTLLGALAGGVLPDPAALGLNTAAPAAFLALLAPRLTARGARDARVTALTAALGVLALVRYTPVGVPVIAAALVAITIGLRLHPTPTPAPTPAPAPAPTSSPRNPAAGR